MQNIFDSHAHYDDPVFDPDRETLLQRLNQEGVCHIINVGADLEGSKASLALAQKYPFIHASVGVHPGSVKEAAFDDLTQLEALAIQERVVAIGEIGLVIIMRIMRLGKCRRNFLRPAPVSPAAWTPCDYS